MYKMNDAAHFEALLEPVLAEVGLELDGRQLALLARHFNLLLKWNARMNLTAVRDPAKIVQRHFGESLFVAAALPSDTRSLVDIGSGAGFPGFPIAVAKPGLQVTLVESVGKKAAFLKEVARRVDNVRVFPGRFEDVHDTFDWAVIRAVAPKPLLEQIKSRAAKLAVILGEDDAHKLATVPGFKWSVPAPLPWSGGRTLLVGFT